ncbi:SDR family NAD(P)-dependent oxidoreductase [Isoalcanivorax indicus]|uniref:SDR family NAD(P)-dependent oxidoreductase n=1 Tax=Isoalcanivorax indicus TaxID=2202653 RepID=UPI000DBA9B97|nr:SDR family NAD(P)-dependent oxidoreductase [Isoalcanivorax indicus]
MTELFSMTGKRVLVTGASSGFGAHFARVLAGAGADLVLAARRVERLEETAEAVRALGREATVVPMDVSDYASVKAAFETMPPVQVVINNAGINRISTTHELSEGDWDAVLDTNLKGVWAVAQQAIQRWMAEGQGGNIINIASVLGLRVGQQLGAYTASKAAVVQMTKSIALDYARYGIRCNAICPGYFETEINRDWLHSPAGEKQIKRIPFHRVGDMPEMSGPLLLLASDASSYMSGAAVPVDGAHLCSTL